jgi:hypothetical protein
LKLSSINRQHVQFLLAALAIFARERNDVTRVGGIVKRHREAWPSSFAVEKADDLACNIVTGDPERFAVSRHQGKEIDVRPFVLARGLDEACEANGGARGYKPVTLCYARFQRKRALPPIPNIRLAHCLPYSFATAPVCQLPDRGRSLRPTSGA